MLIVTCNNSAGAVTGALEAIKDNDKAVKAYGITLGAEMCKQLGCRWAVVKIC